MVWVALATVAVLAASSLIGAAVWRLAGLGAPSHVAPITGFAVLLVLVLPAVFLPGHAWTGLALAVVLTLAAAAVPVVRADVRAGLADGVPVYLLGLLGLMLPFIVSGHFGILGMGNNDDWTMHLIVVRWLAHHEIPVRETVVAVGYPVGPHAIAASLTALGLTAPQALTAVMAAGPILCARAALSVLETVRRPFNWALALVAGLSYLGAAYYAQASHKEVLAAVPILGFALTLPAVARAVAAGGRAEAIRAALAPALLIVSATQVISGGAALWPIGTFCVWALIELARRRHVPAMLALARRAAPTVAAGIVMTLILQAPEITRIVHFQSSHFANEPDGGVGNLGGRLPPWKAFGIWFNPDFRFATHLPVLAGLLLIGAALLILAAFVHWIRRGPSSPAAALIVSWGLWVGLSLFRNPYNAAKGLAMMAPLMGLALATGAVLVWSLREHAALRTAIRAATVAVVVAAGISTFLALRDGIVGPDAHAAELRSIEAYAKTGPTAFLEQSDFGGWDLYALRPYRPTLLYKVNTLPTQPKKGWRQGMALDLDGMSAQTMNRFKWIVAPNTPFASFAPPGLRVVKRTPSWLLWQRTGTVAPFQTLSERWRPGAVLDCGKPSGRALSRRTGTATVRTKPVIGRTSGWVGFADAAGSSAGRTLHLPPGRWDLSLQYQSRNPLTVSAPGMHRRMPANLDRMGSFFLVGTVTGGGPVRVGVAVDQLGLIGRLLGARGQTRALNSPGFHALGEIAATPHGERPQRIPLARACGRYVDSYTLG